MTPGRLCVMSSRPTWQYGISDLLVVTVCAAIGAWSVRDIELAQAWPVVLVFFTTIVIHGSVWLAVIRDIRYGRHTADEHKTGKVLMAACGVVPWALWFVFAVWYGTRSSLAVLHRSKEGLLDVAALVL